MKWGEKFIFLTTSGLSGTPTKNTQVREFIILLEVSNIWFFTFKQSSCVNGIAL